MSYNINLSSAHQNLLSSLHPSLARKLMPISTHLQIPIIKVCQMKNLRCLSKHMEDLQLKHVQFWTSVPSIGQVEDGHMLMLTMEEALVMEESIGRDYWSNGGLLMLMTAAIVHDSWWRVEK
uniref:Aap1 n=1 Tax=Arundo donax TaxID=35708 RepID=A0A0A9DVT8_ARUDO